MKPMTKDLYQFFKSSIFEKFNAGINGLLSHNSIMNIYKLQNIFTN